MKTVLKWVAIILGVLIVVALVGGWTLNARGSSNLANAPAVAVVAVSMPTDDAALAAAIARGEHLYHAISACEGCHGEDLSGEVMIDARQSAICRPPNLTAGVNGIGAAATDEQLVAALRHGVGHDGRTLALMPSTAYAHLSDEDVAALVAYIRQAAPVDSDVGPRNITFPGTILFGVFGNSAMPVNVIDHAAVGGAHPAEGPNAAYGEYLIEVGACRDCHAANLAGNVNPNGPPLGPNITPGSELGGWTEEQFLAFMRSGVTPDGRQVSEEMPWVEYANMTDDEIVALWAI
ncbi:MAG: cytochrome c [Caldilineaceae bacterium]|nr:cytochrome c [Caldilineaceae bacterium]